MAWNIDYKRLSIPTPPTDMIFDGSLVWVVAGQFVYIYDYWNKDSAYEDGLHDMQYYPDFDATQTIESLVLVQTINLTVEAGINDLLEITKVYDHMYISNKTTPALTTNTCSVSTELFKINIQTQQHVNTISIPFIAHSNPAGGFNKVWMSDAAVIDINVKQKIYSYDVDTGLWSSGKDIGINKQMTKHTIVNGLSDWMIIDAYNQNGIAKIDGITGQFDGLIVTNRLPTAITARSDRSLLVSGAAGMISVVDQLLDTSVSTYSSYERASHVVDDGTYLWALTPELTRTIKATTVDNIKYTAAGEEGFKLSPFEGLFEFTNIKLTEQFTYQWWNGSSFETRVVRQYVFIIEADGITNFRNTSWYRSNTISVRGTGMVAVGVDGYFGEASDTSEPPINLAICV